MGGYERKEKPSKEEILQMIEAGFYGVQIAKKWNLSKTVFYKLCKDYKIRLPKGKKQSVTK